MKTLLALLGLFYGFDSMATMVETVNTTSPELGSFGDVFTIGIGLILLLFLAGGKK